MARLSELISAAWHRQVDSACATNNGTANTTVTLQIRADSEFC